MATITMDTSEYEALKSNIDLLTKSKEREHELHCEIQKLNGELLQKTLDNEKSVTTINRTEITEHMYNKVDYGQLLRELHSMFNQLRNYRGIPSEYELELWFNRNFAKHTSINKSEPEVIQKGIEEFKQEYWATLDEETKSKLNKAKEVDELKSKISELEFNTVKLNNQIDSLTDRNDKLIEDCNRLRDKYRTENENSRENRRDLENQLSKSWTWFTACDRRKALENILEKWNG